MQQPRHGQLRVHPAFVGRTSEVRWLERCLQEALVGRPQLAIVVGEPGAGKTRMLSETCSRARAMPFHIGIGRGDENMELPYRVLADALGSSLDLLAEMSPELAASARDLLAGHKVGSVSSAQADDLDPARAFQAVETALFELLARRPLLLRLDDLQWSDRPSVEGLLRLVHAASTRSLSAPVPIVFLCAWRPLEVEHRLAGLLARLQRESIASVIELGGLSEGEVGELLRVLAEAPLAPRLVAQIHSLTLGNPLFIREIFHHLQGRKLLARRGEAGAVDVHVDDFDLPSDLLSAMSSRTRALPDPTRQVLTMAACMGDRFLAKSLAAVSGLETAALLDLLEEPVRQGILTFDGGAFEFAHPLLRHACFHEASELRRFRLHLEIANSIERLHAGDEEAHAAEIAAHLMRAGRLVDPERMARYARLAGDQAFASCAYGDAARCYVAVLDARGEGASPAECAELHYLAGRSFFRQSEVARAVDHFEWAIEMYERLGEAAGVARARLERARVQITLEPLPYGTLADIEPLERALESLGPDEDPLRGRILSLLAGAHWTARQPERAGERAREALAVADRTADPRLACEAWTALSLAETQTLELRSALESSRRAVACARAANDAWLESTAFSRVPLQHLWRGELDAAELAATESHRVTNRTHAWAERSLADAARVAIAVARGRFAEAEALCIQVLRDAERSAYPWGAFNALPALASGRFLRGDFPGARAALVTLREPGSVFREAGASIELLVWIYECLIRSHEEKSAELRDRLVGLVGSVPPDGVSEIGAIGGYCAVAEIAAALGEPALAAAVRPALEAAFARGVVVSSGWVFLLPRVLGVAASLAGDWKAAEKRLSEAIDLAASIGASAELARSYLDAAHMRRMRGDPGDAIEARRLARRARELSLPLEMTPVARAASALESELVVVSEPEPRIGSDERARFVSIAVGRDTSGASPPALGHGRWLRELIARAEQDEAPEAPALSTRAPAPAPASEIAILMTDLVGSTELLDRLGDASALEAMHRHNKILRRCLADHIGTEIQHTGDGIFAFFLGPTDAIRCAQAIQREFAQDRLTGPWSLRVRIGVAAGRVLYEEGRLFGAPVNTAARLCAAAQPCQILTSDLVQQLGAESGARFRDLGALTLRGFQRPLRICEVDW